MKLHQEDRVQINSLHKDKVSVQAIATLYDVSEDCILEVIKPTAYIRQLAAEGLTPVEIAAQTGKSRQYVSGILFRDRKKKSAKAEVLQSEPAPDFSRRTEPEDLDAYEQHVLWLLGHVSTLDPLTPLLQEKLKQIRIKQLYQK